MPSLQRSSGLCILPSTSLLQLLGPVHTCLLHRLSENSTYHPVSVRRIARVSAAPPAYDHRTTPTDILVWTMQVLEEVYNEVSANREEGGGIIGRSLKQTRRYCRELRRDATYASR